MNFRSTTLLFGLLLGMLWLFGLTVAHKKTAVDRSYIMPTLQGNADIVIDSITIQRRAKDKKDESFQFTKDKDNDVWTLTLPGVQKSVKVETFRVKQIGSQVKDARHSDEAGVTDDLTHYGLDNPATIVTLKGKAPGKKEQEWKFYIGKESPDQAYFYVNSSERPTKVFAVTKSNIDSMLFKDPNHLRSRRLFEFSDIAAQSVEVKEREAAKAKALALKKGEDNTWRFEEPAFGFADFEGPTPPKDAKDALPKDGFPPAKSSDGGVKGLLGSIATMRVDSEEDFVPLSDEKLDVYGLEDGQESLRIEVGTFKEKGEKSDKKELVKEIMVVGRPVKDKAQVYARLLGDQGIFKLNTKLLEPIKTVLHNPGSLRSMDVLSIDTKKVDALTIADGDETVALLHPEGKPWKAKVGTGKPQKANSQAIDALLETLQGKREIVKYHDGDDAKFDSELKKPAAVVVLYLGGLEEKKAADKKDADKDKKEEKKDDSPQLKKDAKPAATLKFAPADKDTVNVRRELADGTVSRFKVAKTVLDKVLPGDIKLAFLDTSLPEIAADAIDRVVIARQADKIDIQKGWGEKSDRWFFKEGKEPPGKNPTDVAKATATISSLTGLSAKRWLHKLDPKEDLGKYGLKMPSLEVNLHVKKDGPAGAALLVSLLGTPTEWRGVLAGTAALAYRQLDPGAPIVLKIGKETDQAKDKPAFYAQRSDKDMLFLVPADFVRALREADLRDRTAIVAAQPLLDAMLLGLGAAESSNALLLSSPLATNQVQSFDPAKVKELKLAIRSREELRTLTFQRDPKAKEPEWRDQSGLQEFNLDAEKVKQFVEQLASLKANRWVNVAGGTKSEQKLTPKEASLRVEAILEDGQAITLTVGEMFERTGFYAQSSAWPEAVFLLAPGQIEPILRGPGYFAKERVATAP